MKNLGKILVATLMLAGSMSLPACTDNRHNPTGSSGEDTATADRSPQSTDQSIRSRMDEGTGTDTDVDAQTQRDAEAEAQKRRTGTGTGTTGPSR